MHTTEVMNLRRKCCVTQLDKIYHRELYILLAIKYGAAPV